MAQRSTANCTAAERSMAEATMAKSTMAKRVVRAAVVGALGAMTSGCPVDWRAQVEPDRVSSAPEQTLVEGAPTTLTFGRTEAVLTPRARYRLTAYALITDDTMRDPWSDVAGLDVAFGWGPVASATVLRRLHFHLKRRYVSVRWGQALPLGPRQVMNHLANHHLIAADADVARTLGRIRPGDLVTLEGDLVDVSVDGQLMRTSLSRTDIGNGACEVLYVERVTRKPPPSLSWDRWLLQPFQDL